MDEQVEMIKSFCKGNTTFDELTEEVKVILIDGELVNEYGDFTDTGKIYRKAVLAKPIPGQGINWTVRP